MLKRATLFAALSALGAAANARAEDPRGDARAHYARGLELAGQNGYAGALQEFNAAYAISPQYAVLYNIGQAHIALGQTTEAIETLSRYLHDGADRIAPARREQVERQIAWLRSEQPSTAPTSEREAERATAAAAGKASAAAAETAHAPAPPTGTGTLTVRCNDPALKLVLDGKHLDLAATLRGLAVPAGPHHLTLSVPGRRTAEQSLTISEGTATVIICENLVPPFVPAGPQPIAVGPPVFTGTSANVDAPTPVIHARTVGYLLGGLGLAVGGSAISLYVWNRGQAEDAQTEYRNIPSSPSAPLHYERAVQYNEDADAVHRNTEFTIGLAVASVALLAGSVYLLVHERRRGDKASSTDVPRSWATVAPGGAVWKVVW